MEICLGRDWRTGAAGKEEAVMTLVDSINDIGRKEE
jgi:hypothetical protein